MQGVQEVAAVAMLVPEPGAQLWQASLETLPVVARNRPAWQSVHWPAPEAENWPAEQVVQLTAPEAENWPAWQSVHWPAPEAGNWPPGQAEQLLMTT